MSNPLSKYGCWELHGDGRGKASTITVQDGWTDDGRRKTREHTAQWIKMACGHNFRTTDPECTGCINRHRE